MNDGYRMSKMKTDRLNLRCKEHQVLNKYYLIKEKKFVCEYDGYDDNGPDSFMHLPQIIEQNRKTILHLQNQQLKSQSPALISAIPNVNSELNNLDLDASTLNSTSNKFSDNFMKKLKEVIFQNEAYHEIKEIIDQIKFNNDGKADLRKIGMDTSKELNLITLAQLLVLNQDNNVDKKDLHKDLTDFLENYQDELLELVNQSNKTIDLINGDFAHEVAKMEGKQPEPNKYINKFKMMYMNKPESERIIKEKENDLLNKNQLISQRDKIINQLTTENARLNEQVNELLKAKDRVKILETSVEKLDKLLDSEKNKHLEEIESLKKYYEKLLKEMSNDKSTLMHNNEIELENLRNLLSQEKTNNKKSIDALRQKNEKDIDEMSHAYQVKINELEALLSHLKKEKEIEKRSFEKEIELLQNQLIDSHNKTNDYYKKRISELELLLMDQEKENVELKEIYEKELLDMKRKHDISLNQIKEENKVIINDLENKLLNEKSNSKMFSIEKDSLNSKLNEALNKIIILEEEIKFLKLSNEMKIQSTEAQIKEILLLKEKLHQDIENERLICNNLNLENDGLREHQNKLNLKIVGLEESLKANQFREDKSLNQINNNLLDLKREKDSLEKKYQGLENSFVEERKKYTSIICDMEAKYNYRNEEINELIRIRESYLDRISELEKEVYELRNKMSTYETEKANLNRTIIDLNNQINSMTNNSKSSKNEDVRKLTELSSQVNNFPKIKEMLNNKIIDLETQLAKEKSDFVEYQKKSENRLHSLQTQSNEANNNNMNLTHQLEIAKSELENQKLRQDKKIAELTSMLQEMTRLKDKNQADFSQEKAKLNQTIIELERKLKETTFQHEENSNKNDFNFKRVRELEIILSEERKKYENLVTDCDKKITDLNNKITQIQLTNQEIQKLNYSLELDLKDEKSNLASIVYERDNLVKNFKEKELNYNKIIQELRKAKLEDDKTISELSSKVNDFNRVKNNLESRIFELEELLKVEREKNLSGCYSHEKLIKDLQIKFDESLRAKDFLEKENSDLKTRFKVLILERDSLFERKKKLEEANIELNQENEELKKIKDLYLRIKKDFEKLNEDNKNLNIRIKQLQDELAHEKLRFNQLIANLNNKISELNKEIQQLHVYNDKLNNEIDDLKNKLKNLQLENDLLQSKLDEQYNEINALRDSNKSIADLLKKIEALNHNNTDLNQRIKILEEELAKKNKQLEAANQDNKNLKDKVDELNKKLEEFINANKTLNTKVNDQNKKIDQLNEIIKNLQDQLSQQQSLVSSAPPKQRDYRNIDFAVDDYNDLLLHKRNWPILEPWLTPLKSRLVPNVKLNLIYKATRDGFKHTDFKDKCLNIPNTLVVVLTEFNKLIGGFTPLEWVMPKEGSHEYAKDEKKRSFMFTLSNGKRYGINKPHYAICNSREFGPIFGGGSDLEIVSECNRMQNNYGDIGHSYEFEDIKSDFYGGDKFTVKDYEVYEVLL